MIDRETAIALAKEADFPFNKYGLLQGDDDGVVDADEKFERLCNLAVAHSRKDAEPVWFHANGKYGEHRFYRPDEAQPVICTPLYTHPPEADKNAAALKWVEGRLREFDQEEADKLLQQALDALEDESLVKINNSVAAIRTYLEGKK